MTYDELKELLESIAKRQEETSIQMKETDRKMQETDRKMQETDRKMQETDRKLNSVCDQLGGISKNSGAIAEEYFYNSLESKMSFAGEHYDSIFRNLIGSNGTISAEFDIVLANGKSLVIVEVKSKAHENNLQQLIKQADNIKLLFSIYRDYKIYLALASLSFYPKLEQEASKLGIAILKQKGDVMEIHDKNLIAY